MMWYDSGMGWGGWFLMAVMMVLFWGLVIAAVLALAHYLGGFRKIDQPSQSDSSGAGRSGARAEGLLAERFARGEIDEDDYKRRIMLLRELR